ncbi:MAG: hypothetical protein JWM21_931 [Acidobacteria bacterium]|nr:hypothetical protein [Acidobacteriota bacterium]
MPATDLSVSYLLDFSRDASLSFRSVQAIRFRGLAYDSHLTRSQKLTFPTQQSIKISGKPLLQKFIVVQVVMAQRRFGPPDRAMRKYPVWKIG